MKKVTLLALIALLASWHSHVKKGASDKPSKANATIIDGIVKASGHANMGVRGFAK
jgi:hypothetical protein